MKLYLAPLCLLAHAAVSSCRMPSVDITPGPDDFALVEIQLRG